jgi:hypothetical protein
MNSYILKRQMVFCLAVAGWLVSSGPQTVAAADQDSPQMQNVAIQQGQTLWAIAHQYLKDADRWNELPKYNPLLSSDPMAPLPAMTLHIPLALIKEELRAAHLVQRVNQVLYRRRSTAQWQTAQDGMDLYRNDWIRTLADAKAQVRFLDDDVLQLGANSMALIKPMEGTYTAELKHAGTFVGRGRLVTATANVTPQSRDTKYVATVRDDLSTVVQVYKGAANVESAGRKVAVSAGMGTEVLMGKAPSLPAAIPDLPNFNMRMAKLDTDLAAGKALVVLPSAPNRPQTKRGTPPTDFKKLKSALPDMEVGQAISGYRVQCNLSQDFSRPLVNRTFDGDEFDRLDPATLNLPGGRAWCRIAVIDLLGSQGKFSQPQLIGAGSAASAKAPADAPNPE